MLRGHQPFQSALCQSGSQFTWLTIKGSIAAARANQQSPINDFTEGRKANLFLRRFGRATTRLNTGSLRIMFQA